MAVPEKSLAPAQQGYLPANLGDGQVFIKRTPTGMVKAVKGKIRLEERKGHLAVIENKVMITAAGYREMNRLASVSIVTPNQLTLPDGKIVVNPYPIIDGHSGSISKVWVKKFGVGLSPIGNLTITSSTLLYDITMYCVQDLAKKVQFNKGAGKICLRSGLSEAELKNGIFLPIEGELGVWADYNHAEILKGLNTFIQNKLFAERKAQTVCERNVLKMHPALSQVYVEPQGPEKGKWADVIVVGWTHDFTKEDLLNFAAKAERGEEIRINERQAEVVDAGSDITEDDLAASSEDDDEPIAGANGYGSGGQTSFFQKEGELL